MAALPGEAESAVLIDLPTGKEVGRVKGSAGSCRGAAFSPDGRSVTVWDYEHTATVWDVESRRQVRQFEFAEASAAGVRAKPKPMPAPGARRPRSGWSYGAAASPDGRLIAYGSQDGYLALHEAASGKLVRAVPAGADGACFFAFTPDSRMLAWVGW